MPLLSVTMVPSDELAVLSSVTSAAAAPDDVPADVLADVLVDDEDEPADDDPAGLAGSGVDDPQTAESRRSAPVTRGRATCV